MSKIFAGSRLWLVLMLIAALAVTASCASDEGAEQDDPEVPDVQEEFADRVIYGLRADPVTLDPQVAIDQPSGQVTRNIYSALFRTDGDGNVVEDLATGYQISDDNLTWTFQLRDDVYFHDGTKFNAEAVKFVFDRQFDESLGLAFRGRWKDYVEGPDKIRLVDDYTLEIETLAPSPYFHLMLSTGFPGSIPSPAAIEKYGEDLGRNPVGTGPFKFVEWVSGERVVLEAYEDYHGEGPYIQTLEMRIISEDSARMMALEAGDIHMAANIPPHSIGLLEGRDDIDVIHSPLFRVFYWAFNCTRPYLEDVRVRQAMNLAIDRETLVEHVLQGVGTVTQSHLSPASEGYHPSDVFSYDPERAVEMLEEAGWDFDRELVAFITSGRYYQDRESGEAYAGMLSEIGVDVQTQVLEWGAFVDAVWFTPHDDELAQERDFAQTTWGSDNIAWTLRAVLHGDAWPPTMYNEAFFADEQVDALIHAINTEMDTELRLQHIEAVQERLAETAPWIPGFVETLVFAKTSDLEGVEVWLEGIWWNEAKLRIR